MKVLIILLIALLSVAYAGQEECATECFESYCITPHANNKKAQQECTDKFQTYYKCAVDSCAKSNFDSGCIKKRCTKDPGFVDFVECAVGCGGGLLPQTFRKTFKTPPTPPKTFTRIHELSKRNNLIERQTKENTPKPATPPPTNPKTFSKILSSAVFALIVVLAF